MPDEKHRINGFHAFSLMVFALGADTAQLFLGWIPLGGVLIGALSRLIFWIWFKVLGVGFADTSTRYFLNIGMTFMEILPLINFAPTWSIGTVMIIRNVHSEDKKYNKEQQKKFAAGRMVDTHFPNGALRKHT